MTQLVDYLIEQKGIGSNFVDAWGKPATTKRKTQEKLLQAMGYLVNDEGMLTAQLEAEAVEYWLKPLASVFVVRIGDNIVIHMRTSIDNAAKLHSIKFVLESGKSVTHKFAPVDTLLSASQEIDGLEWQEYAIELPKNIRKDIYKGETKALGYHNLQLMIGPKILARSRFIVAPLSCFIPKSIKQGKKIWGLSVQLYCLRSKNNWGIGDFTDLTLLVKESATLGADFIGLNPIHALYPANPDICSPYGPSSRRWLNSLYLDVTNIDGFESPSVQLWMQQNDIEQKLTALRATDFVGYFDVAEIKYKALGLIFAEYKKKYLGKKTSQNEAFKTFIKAGGKSLQTLAIFEALQITLKNAGKDCWGWPAFPEQYRSADSPAVVNFAKQEKKLIEFYLFLQWQAAEQFAAASSAATNAGMEIGLYRDLAVGVSDGSAEIWGNKDLYCTDVSVGAPADVLGPLGQKWGLPPMDPSVLIEQQYQPVIDLFSSNMSGSGALRIDHVMALLRLWWVHKDDHAIEGAYVNYPVDDLLAILALESVRNKSLVIGEDLGTVPDFIRDKLYANGMYSYRVFFFEQAEDGGFYSPSHYPVQSMATLTTHDMPTLSGFWHCDDLALGKEVGLYPDPEMLSSLYNIRHENKQQILNTLHGHGSISHAISDDVHNVGMTRELNFGMQLHMAAGSSALLSLQLEDWLQMDKPVNIPGTYSEYPNWRRKLSLTLEDIFIKPEVRELTKQLSERRKGASN
ncbi:MAG: 4-alpha-glucanotransferase [Kangiellaceae bacterium]|jgi:4-alpha-glucanotransferase